MSLQSCLSTQHVQVSACGALHARTFINSCRPPAKGRSQCTAIAAQKEEFVPTNSRRQLLHAGCTTLLLSQAGAWGPARAEPNHINEAVSASSGQVPLELVAYVNRQQHYQLRIPARWEKKDKAGADVLFEDPGRRSTSVGVTVSPVRIASIKQFGDLATVGQRLLEAEGKKESTLDVQLLSSSSRAGSAGAVLYDFEYELNSTRGVKRILNTVTITGSRLYILNGNFKCDKDAGCAAAEGTVSLLRDVASSFDAGSLL